MQGPPTPNEYDGGSKVRFEFRTRSNQPGHLTDTRADTPEGTPTNTPTDTPAKTRDEVKGKHLM